MYLRSLVPRCSVVTALGNEARKLFNDPWVAHGGNYTKPKAKSKTQV